jgi:hypothetical protein
MTTLDVTNISEPFVFYNRHNRISMSCNIIDKINLAKSVEEVQIVIPENQDRERNQPQQITVDLSDDKYANIKEVTTCENITIIQHENLKIHRTCIVDSEVVIESENGVKLGCKSNRCFTKFF